MDQRNSADPCDVLGKHCVFKATGMITTMKVSIVSSPEQISIASLARSSARATARPENTKEWPEITRLKIVRCA
jgi:hypothetical protein